MSCSFCSNSLVFGTNTCSSCLCDGRSLIDIFNKIEIDNPGTGQSVRAASKSYKGFTNALKLARELKEPYERLTFLSGFSNLFKEKIHTDIMVNPGNNGTPIPAHKAVLVTRSPIFKNMLESDECKAPASESITIPELNHEQLESLLEFLYSGTLPNAKIKKHIYTLLIAADKYDIPFLHKFCENHLIGSLSIANALNVLLISQSCSNHNLEETALNFIVKNAEVIILSDIFKNFVPENPQLALKIMQESLLEIKGKRTKI